MANELSNTIPAIGTKYYDDTTKPQNKDAMAKIYNTYKDAIDRCASLTHVPQAIITSFIFIESAGNPNAVSGAGAIGLMQLIPSSASDILVIENTKKRLSSEEKQILAQNLGARFTLGIDKMAYLGQKLTVGGVTSATWITKADLLKPSLNILIGCIYLGILIDESTKNGKCNLHKVVIRYNRGYFADNAGKNISDDIQTAMVNSPTETQNYILKFVGKNGTLDTLLA